MGPSDVVLVQGNTGPPLKARISTGIRKTPQNLTGAAVTVSMWAEDGELIIDSATVDVVDAAKGRVQYDWQSQDTELVGLFYVRFNIVFTSGEEVSAPNNDYIVVAIFAASP